MRISAPQACITPTLQHTPHSPLKCKADVYSVSLENEVLAYFTLPNMCGPGCDTMLVCKTVAPCPVHS